MLYEDNLQGDIITEDEMVERLHEYITMDDIIETMRIIGLDKIYEGMCDEQKINIYMETVDLISKEGKYFTKRKEEEE